MKHKIIGLLIFFTALFFLINAIWPISYFLKALSSTIDILIWSCYVFGLLYCLYQFFKRYEKSREPSLVPDEAQAERVLQILRNKCLGRKALMIVAPWGYGKTSFYTASLEPLLVNNFPKSRRIAISCFGMSTPDDLIAQILNESLYIESFAILSSRLQQIFSSTSHFKRGLIPKELIIMIDDFERFSGKHSELIGLFDYLIREKKCLLIVLCNEEKLNDSQYKELPEKIIERYPLKITEEHILNILKSDSFYFNQQKYSFQEPVLHNFVKIIDATKNLRTAWGAHIDLKEISEQLIDRLKDIDYIPGEKKEAGLKKYFEEHASSIIKAVFIKNQNKHQEYLNYIGSMRHLDHFNFDKEHNIEDEFLSIIGSITLSINDRCTADYKLLLPGSMIIYLNGGELFDEQFIDETVAEFILEPDIVEKIKNSSGDIQMTANKDAIEKAFFTFFKFICSVPLTQYNTSGYCYMLIVYKIFSLKFSLKLSEKESKLIDELELKLTKPTIANYINGIKLPPTDHPSYGLINTIDPERKFIQQLVEEYDLTPPSVEA